MKKERDKDFENEISNLHNKLINEWHDTKFTKIKCEFERLKNDYYDIMETKNNMKNDNKRISDESEEELDEISSVITTFDELVFEHLNIQERK